MTFPVHLIRAALAGANNYDPGTTLMQATTELQADYDGRFRPLLDRTLQRLANPAEELNQRLARVTANAQGSAELARLAGSRALARYGRSATSEQGAALARDGALAGALSEANVRNRTREAFGEEQESMLEQYARMGRDQLGSALGDLRNLNGMEAQRQGMNRQAQAQQHQSNVQTGVSVVATIAAYM